MKSLVIFDLDGTLLNTIDDLGVAANHALAAGGFPTHPLEAYPMMVGNGVSRLIERALPDECRSMATVDRLLVPFREFYDSHMADATKPYPGIEDLLVELQGQGVALAVASNKYQEAVTRLMDIFFPTINWVAVEGNRPGVPRKPDPSIVFDILSTHPCPKADTLYVGDSGIDMETARRACIESVGVTWGFRPVSELRDNHADHIIYNPADILPIVSAEGI
ncbi:MAG: HAD family hydrolase [Pseudoflavonifractor sp.]|nr:HAD family hydrolase [Alloprevotella sp.]MCM1115943.1 HAD family hydrolase [Pseudoflavonifractor sp.]